MTRTTQKIGFFAALTLVLLSWHSNANAYNTAPMAYYNNYSAQGFDVATVDKLLSQRTTINALRSFVPQYPQPQQRYIQAPIAQPIYTQQQPAATGYTPYQPYYRNW